MTYLTLNLVRLDLETFLKGQVAWFRALGLGCPSHCCFLSLAWSSVLSVINQPKNGIIFRNILSLVPAFK